jgi:hypothetical protein
MVYLFDKSGRGTAMVEIIELAPQEGFSILLHINRENGTSVTEICGLHFDTLREAELYAMRELGVGDDEMAGEGTD